MDNNTTLDQQSPVDDEVVHEGRQFQSSMDDLHMSMDDLAFFKLDEQIHSTWKSFNSP